MGKPRYKKDVNFREVNKTWSPKRIWYRQYIALTVMVFQTKVIGYNGVIARDSDGVVLASLTKDGKLTVYPGYFWDGPSGPTIDTIAFIIASIPHDVLYQMLREDILIDTDNYPAYPSAYYEEFKKVRLWADDTMKFEARLNGMSRFRAMYTYRGVRWFGESSALSIYVKRYNDNWRQT
jgi:hypothetical protein